MSHFDSSPHLPRPSGTASRIMTSVRRSLSTAKRRDPEPPQRTAMYSTPAERNRTRQRASATKTPLQRVPPSSRSPWASISRARPTCAPRASTPSAPRPTRRTPRAPQYPSPAPNALLPQKVRRRAAPLRVSPRSVSSTTDVTSTVPSTPQSSERSSASLRARMSRFLPTYRGSSTPSSALSSPHTSTSELQHARKKAVRFSSTVEEED
ncbi:hypothetical protein B0H10DRAFT_2215275 [Mycena sp. CBHHK59/15]|nr:hypothetical protein B0H10DRAFT_2215275 [Mycena sp. CBHHK59/15]